MPMPPNILLIMTDQQRFDTIGALGNPLIQTPALDRLVRDGTSFTSAYCPSPVCMASRCSLLLGEYPHRTGCTSNSPMPQERTSLMQYLASAGYETHGVGKMHFGPDSRALWGYESRDYSEEGGGDDDFRAFLTDNGYDHIVAPQGERSEFYYIPQPSQLPPRLHNTQWTADRTLDFLARRDRQRPFFCWTSFIKPHPPFESPVPWSRLYRSVEMPLPYLPEGYEHLLTHWNRLQNRYKYRDQGTDLNLLRTMRAAYCAAISFVDYNVGRILDRLQSEGVLDRTLILFTSDHGEFLGDYGSYGKRSFLDVAARVPLLARFPERFPIGSRCDEPTSLVDILPTCLAAAGLEKEPRHAGTDLAQVAAKNVERMGVLGQFSQDGGALYMLATRSFKYIHSAPDRREWLLTRTTGAREERSLAGNPAFADVLARLRDQLINRLREDGYDSPLDGNAWREFPPLPSVPSDPDAWQLFQDGRSVSDRFPAGYAPRVDTMKPYPVRGF